MKTEAFPTLVGKTIVAVVTTEGRCSRGLGRQIMLVFGDGAWLEIYGDPQPAGTLGAGGIEGAVAYAVCCNSTRIEVFSNGVTTPGLRSIGAGDA